MNKGTLEGYAEKASKTAIYPGRGTEDGIWYTVLGLAGEVGELANKAKKIKRDNVDCYTKEYKDDMAAELGDVLWYWTQVAWEFGLDVEVIAYKNLKKLADRANRGKLTGSGDKR